MPSETGENGSASLLELAFLFLSSPVACIFNLSVGSQESLSLGYGGVQKPGYTVLTFTLHHHLVAGHIVSLSQTFPKRCVSMLDWSFGAQTVMICAPPLRPTLWHEYFIKPRDLTIGSLLCH